MIGDFFFFGFLALCSSRTVIAQCPLNLGDGDGAANLLANRSRAWLSINDMIERGGWVTELLDRMEERGREKKKRV